MPTFIIENKYGVAIINADSQEEAFRMLKDREGEEEFLALKKSVKDVIPLSTKRGIVAYHYNG